MVGVLQRIRERDPTRSFAGLVFFTACAVLTSLVFTLVYRARVHGKGNIPRRGGLLVVANHQSHLDPPLIGMALWPRHVVPIARMSLFKFPPLAWLLRGLGVIALRDNEGDAGAMRAAIGALKAGRMVVIFPEGSRSPDGSMQDFKRGAWVLVSRAGCDVLPVAVEGCYGAWPRSRKWPRLVGCRCEVNIGKVIPYAELRGMKSVEGLGRLAREVEGLREGMGGRRRAL